MNNIAAMERRCFRDHAPEIVRRYGPRLARHESDLPVFAPPESRQPGLYRFFTYKVIKEPIALPGVWPLNKFSGERVGSEALDRVCEIWHETFDDWWQSVIGAPPKYTPPLWSKYEKYPFLEPFKDFALPSF